IVLFPMSLHGPGLPEPCAQVRASSHVGCILGATREREPREGSYQVSDVALLASGNSRPMPTEMSVEPEERSRAKNVLSLCNPNRRSSAAAWRFGYSVGRRIMHITLKRRSVRPQRKSGKSN